MNATPLAEARGATRRFGAFTAVDGVTLQVHGNGPFTVTYVNAADDPRVAAPVAN